MLERLGAFVSLFDQCPLGAEIRKGTCIAGVWDSLPSLNGLRCSGLHQHARSIGFDEAEVPRSRRFQEYPPRLNRILAKGGVSACLRMLEDGSGPGG